MKKYFIILKKFLFYNSNQVYYFILLMAIQPFQSETANSKAKRVSWWKKGYNKYVYSATTSYASSSKNSFGFAPPPSHSLALAPPPSHSRALAVALPEAHDQHAYELKKICVQLLCNKQILIYHSLFYVEWKSDS